jgi:hypothetical protein
MEWTDDLTGINQRNVRTESLVLLCIQEVPGSNFDLETGSPD